MWMNLDSLARNVYVKITDTKDAAFKLGFYSSQVQGLDHNAGGRREQTKFLLLSSIRREESTRRAHPRAWAGRGRSNLELTTFSDL